MYESAVKKRQGAGKEVDEENAIDNHDSGTRVTFEAGNNLTFAGDDIEERTQDAEYKDSKDKTRKQKSLLVTYLLWLIFGWFGAHHFYLGRDRHAFLWFATLGGYFGFGNFRDMWKIPSYIREANGLNKAEISKKRKENPYKPSFDWSLFFGEITVGNLFSMLWANAVPEEPIYGWNLQALIHLYPIASAIGVHVVGNIGVQKGEITWPVIGCSATYIFANLFGFNTNWCSTAGAFLFEKKAKRWRRGRTKRVHCCKRLGVLFLCGIIYSSLWLSYGYFNAEITDSDGEKVKLRDAVGNFLNSPMWNDVVESLKQMYSFAQHHGWWKVWEDFVEKLDPHGEQNALKVLGLNSSATQEEITATYKKLARELHPDKQKDPEKKAEAQEKFIALQQAYERLSSLKNRRLKRNKKHQEL